MIRAVPDRATFRALRRRGRRVRGGPLTIVYLSSTSPEEPALAFAVPRRAGPAVARNRFRRRVRELFREAARDGRVAPGAYLVSPVGACEDAGYEELRVGLANALDRLDEAR